MVLVTPAAALHRVDLDGMRPNGDGKALPYADAGHQIAHPLTPQPAGLNQVRALQANTSLVNAEPMAMDPLQAKENGRTQAQELNHFSPPAQLFAAHGDKDCCMRGRRSIRDRADGNTP